MQNTNLLDCITTNKTMYGVIDHVTTKYVAFYDLTMNENPYLVKVVLIWRSYFTHMRFSMFVDMYFRSLQLGHPILLNKKTITTPTPTTTQKPKRKIEKVSPRNTGVVDFV